MGWGWGAERPAKGASSSSRSSVCGGETLSVGRYEGSRSMTRLHPQYLSAGPGARPCGGKGARRSSAPLLREASSSAKDVRVPFADALSPLSYDPYGPYSIYGLYTSTSLGGSPHGSPRMSPRSSPRRRSRVMSRDLCLEDLVVVSVPCRERKVEGVRLVERGSSNSSSSSTGSAKSKPSAGILYLTATHLIFVDSSAKKETWILHMHISSVEKLPLSTQGSPLHIRCKTFLSVTFVIPKERDCHEIFTALLQLSQPATLDDLFCFHYMNSTSSACSSDSNNVAGWDLYNVTEEYARMRVPSEAWVLTTQNNNHQICDTYPKELYVPASATKNVIIGSSKFRSKGRFPVLTYLHTNQAALCRCSQPLSGFSARCLEDEQMLEAIRKANKAAIHMTVVDTRPKINAMANRATGKGYENEAFYENIKFHFTGIENIHVMRSSLAKLIDTCQLVSPSMSAWLSGVEGSGWLRHVRSVLESGVLVAKEIASGVSVLVHCSDGWDRTAQTCALAQILLDPYYRTMHGFQVLVEKDWLSFGHKFTDRSGLIQGEAKEVSPIFTQFLECVWQLQQMYPSSFEFNERYLLVLHDHVFSAQFGTFVGNCQKDRLDLKLSQRTVSLWSYLAGQVMEHTNPLYRSDILPTFLTPSLAPQALQFWRGLYCRYWSGVHPREPLCDLLSATQDHSKALEAQAMFLSKRIGWLSDQLRKKHGDSHGNDQIKEQLDNRLVDAALDQNGHLKNDPLGAFSSLGLSNKHSGNPVLIETSPDKCNTAIAPSPAPVVLTTTQPLSPTQAVSSRSALSSVISDVAIDWQSLRCVTECSCSTPFNAASRKHHCWMCGEVFCTRCIDKRASLPGHLSLPPAPVCRPCYKTITRSLSVDTP
ncbi:myotubularin-related protein 6 isoform X2 [Hyalella azteca]|uniref:phosphatidylinositol-3,5-bisphosphate 3-phosphatase n=1 Tax=Hyalella azteca TaxID=294128 RepID=A0A979FSY5_HYAAZ|nr:myotubularin-related protein 6 isoform X2 [Hyalella azteca]